MIGDSESMMGTGTRGGCAPPPPPPHDPREGGGVAITFGINCYPNPADSDPGVYGSGGDSIIEDVGKESDMVFIGGGNRRVAGVAAPGFLQEEEEDGNDGDHLVVADGLHGDI